MGNKKLLIIGGSLFILAIILIMLIIIFKGIGGSVNVGSASLEFWGVFDEKEYYQGAIESFNAKYPGVKITYKGFTYEEYETQLVNAFAAGRGPDIWLLHNTWLPRHKDKILPLPEEIQKDKEMPMTPEDFKDQFVDVTEKDLLSDGQIYALPIYVDTLALFYNRDLFNTNGITQPPKTWEEVNSITEKITKIDQDNNINQSSIAMGTAENINRSTDIVSLLMLQSGVPLASDDQSGVNFSAFVDGKNVGQAALEYYTDFANPRKRIFTWNDQMPYSVDAFREGNTAMMLNYSHQIKILREQSPRLNFDIASMPQVSGSRESINYANYWAPTVSKNSKNPTEAWKFLVHLSSKDGAISYINSSNRPPARNDLIDLVRNDPDLGVFSVQALSAKSWYQIDNKIIEKILAQMINDVNFGRRSIKDALDYAGSQINILMTNRNF